MSFLDQHAGECSPLSPCKNCNAAALLRPKLTDVDMRKLQTILGGDDVPKVPSGNATPVIGMDGYMQLSLAAKGALAHLNIWTRGDLALVKGVELLELPGFGSKARNELRDFCTQNGMRLL